MNHICILVFMAASILCGLDSDRATALNEIITGIESTRNEQLRSKFAKEDPALRDKINSLHDRIISEYRRDVTAGRITEGSQVDKDIKARDAPYKKSVESGRDKSAQNTLKVILYLKWLVGDPSVPTMPEKAVVY